MQLGIFARTLLAAMRSSWLKVVIDTANLIVPGEEQQMRQVLSEAFDLLGEHIIIGHAKDRGVDDTFRAAGEGILDYDHYLRLLQARSFTGPLIIPDPGKMETFRCRFGRVWL